MNSFLLSITRSMSSHCCQAGGVQKESVSLEASLIFGNVRLRGCQDQPGKYITWPHGFLSCPPS